MSEKQLKKPSEVLGPSWDIKILGKIGNACSIQYIRLVVNGKRRDNTDLAQRIKVAALELKKERKAIKKINLL